MGGIVNPYQVNINDQRADMIANDEQDDDSGDDQEDENEEFIDSNGETKKKNSQNRKLNEKNRRSGTGRRRRIENENGQTRGRGSRYKRQIIHHDPDASSDTDKWSGSKLAADGDVYYIHIDDILKSQSPNEHLKLKLYKMKQKIMKPKKSNCTANHCLKRNAAKPKKRTGLEEKLNRKEHLEKGHHRRRGDIYELKDVKNDQHFNQKSVLSLNPRYRRDLIEEKYQYETNDNSLPFKSIENSGLKGNETVPPLEQTTEVEDGAQKYSNTSQNDDLQRVKRKSGKTTGALSRPKGGGDSSSKSTSRKDKGESQNKTNI